MFVCISFEYQKTPNYRGAIVGGVIGVSGVSAALAPATLGASLLALPVLYSGDAIREKEEP